MSFEDDEYWEDEYSPHSPVAYAEDGAVAHDRYSPTIPPARRPRTPPQVRTSTWDGEVEPPAIDLDVRPPDELAARRRKRSSRSAGPAAGAPGFDANRPDWLNDPEFVPTDVSKPDPNASDVVDFNRPELGANFDNPELHGPDLGSRAVRSRREPDVVDYLDYDYDDDQYAQDVARYQTDLRAGRETDFEDGQSAYRGDRGGAAPPSRGPGGRAAVFDDGRGSSDRRGRRPAAFEDDRGGDPRRSSSSAPSPEDRRGRRPARSDDFAARGPRDGGFPAGGFPEDDYDGRSRDVRRGPRVARLDDDLDTRRGDSRGRDGRRGSGADDRDIAARRADERDLRGTRGPGFAENERGRDPRVGREAARIRDAEAGDARRRSARDAAIRGRAVVDGDQRGVARVDGPGDESLRPIHGGRDRITVEGFDEAVLDGPISPEGWSEDLRGGPIRSAGGRRGGPQRRSEQPVSGRAQVPDPAQDELYRPRADEPRRDDRRDGADRQVARADDRVRQERSSEVIHPVEIIRPGNSQRPPEILRPTAFKTPEIGRPNRSAGRPQPIEPAPRDRADAGPDRVGSDRVGSDRVGSDRVGSDRAGSDAQRFGSERERDDQAAAAWAAGQSTETEQQSDQDGDGPRVVSKTPPPVTPRVLHKAEPPAAPRVLKKAEPPAQPRVVSSTPPTGPARVVPAAAPAAAPKKPAQPGSASTPQMPAAHDTATPQAPAGGSKGQAPLVPLSEWKPAPIDPAVAPEQRGPRPAGPGAAPQQPATQQPAPQQPAPQQPDAWGDNQPQQPAAWQGEQPQQPAAWHGEQPRQRGRHQGPAEAPQSPAGWRPLSDPATPGTAGRPAPAARHTVAPQPGVASPEQESARPVSGQPSSPAPQSWDGPIHQHGRPDSPRVQAWDSEGRPLSMPHQPAPHAWQPQGYPQGAPHAPGQPMPEQPAARQAPPAVPAQAEQPGQAIPQQPAARQAPPAVPAQAEQPGRSVPQQPAAWQPPPAPEQQTPRQPAAWQPPPAVPASAEQPGHAAPPQPGGRQQPAPAPRAPEQQTPRQPAAWDAPQQPAARQAPEAWAPEPLEDSPRPPWNDVTPVHGVPRVTPRSGDVSTQPVQRPPAPEPVERRAEPEPQPVHRVQPTPQSVPPRVEPTRVGTPRDDEPRTVEETELRIPRWAPPAQPPRATPTHAQPAPAQPTPAQPAAKTGAATDEQPKGERPAPPTPVTQPIGRLVIAGPDTGKRHYVDEDVQVDWFGGGEAKAETAPATEAAGPTGTEPARAGAAPDEPAHGGTAAGGPASAAGDGVVIDFDISGFFDGRGVTAEQALIVARAEAAEKQATEKQAAEQQAAEQQAGDQSAGPQTGGGETVGGAEAGSGPAGPDARPLVAQGGLGPPEATGTQPLSAADLDAIRWRLDGGTLREVVDDRDALRALGERLDGPLADEQDDVTKAGLLSVRAEVYRLLGELGMAAAASRLALVHAHSARDHRSIVIAQAELAHVLRLRGDFGEADRLFEEAASSETPEPLRSVVHENAGRSCFDQGRHMEALDHFARAVRLGPEEDLDLVERIGVSLEAIYIHVLRDGWGPYPRMRREIIGGRPDPADAGPQPPHAAPEVSGPGPAS